ncbi:glucose 1-dehydrogenase [Achromobacter seleniivolatilans]|uniref:Glucose 1-dehydrogenase n=1 Tax=Achromobacter seleniivolatilans TaxID=3047478 RepID=A0ABY9M491_9BURK|nr:glucose 1-dehydrogenase [Achromobacter sp. R39]WMD21833.1 glucose 1-dehydrogenase [Achromobacter sp. R39]
MQQGSELQGRVALVTGASSGIGRASAIALAAAGAQVVVNHRAAGDSQARAAAVVEEIQRSGGQAVTAAADISREDHVDLLFKAVIAHYGRLDILINNAGIEQPAPIADMTLADWQRVIDVNLTGHFLCARAAAKQFTLNPANPARQGLATGNIIFISSVHEVIPWAFQVNYAASKGGIAMLMKSLAQELGPAKVRVNSIAPGAIRTPINQPAWDTPDSLANLLKLIPYGRIGEPEDVARAAVWLASDASDYVTGTTLFVDGGMTLYPEFRGAG